ncbi:MAG: hypothetical protein KDA28_03070, partial [Phycisphaerales bacterium]|nr:hypothetical protein [Phycisphaerales bacterium]
FETPRFHAITDCGAGGFSSAVGEMGEHLGATVHLEKAPLKYEGLTPTEIWISEAQERMVLSVPPAMLDDLKGICAEEHVELAVLGTFGTPGRELVLRYANLEVGRMPMALLHEGIPEPTRHAHWTRPTPTRTSRESPPLDEALRTLIADPRIASKHWIIRQYDHEVQGNLVVKPLVGHGGPGNASVLQPVATSTRGFAVGCGLATGLGDPRAGGDPYVMALAAIDECVRNLVSVGVDPERIAILDNFCWPSCRKPENLGALVRASVGCYDGAKAYRTPFVSGKDSLNNQFTTEDGRTIEIPPTLLITGLGILDDVRRAVTPDAKRGGNRLILVGDTQDALAGSTWWSHWGGEGLPTVDLDVMPRTAREVARLIASGIVRSCTDVSDGGALTAIAEMCIGGDLGAEVDLDAIHDDATIGAFGESPGRYILEVEPQHAHQVVGHRIGWVRDDRVLRFGAMACDIADLRARWRATLDW